VFILNVGFEPIVPMAATWYSDPIRPVPTYVLRAAKRLTWIKFHQDWETSLHRTRQTDGQGYIDNIYLLGVDF